MTGMLGTSQRHVKPDDINKTITLSHGIISSRYEGEGEQVESRGIEGGQMMETALGTMRDQAGRAVQHIAHAMAQNKPSHATQPRRTNQTHWAHHTHTLIGRLAHVAALRIMENGMCVV